MREHHGSAASGAVCSSTALIWTHRGRGSGEEHMILSYFWAPVLSLDQVPIYNELRRGRGKGEEKEREGKGEMERERTEE